MAWCRTDDKPLYETTMIKLTEGNLHRQPQLVNNRVHSGLMWLFSVFCFCFCFYFNTSLNRLQTTMAFGENHQWVRNVNWNIFVWYKSRTEKSITQCLVYIEYSVGHGWGIFSHLDTKQYIYIYICVCVCVSCVLCNDKRFCVKVANNFQV